MSEIAFGMSRTQELENTLSTLIDMFDAGDIQIAPDSSDDEIALVLEAFDTARRVLDRTDEFSDEE